jgi:hypothetical protein
MWGSDDGWASVERETCIAIDISPTARLIAALKTNGFKSQRLQAYRGR